jgi:hypothetical protein
LANVGWEQERLVAVAGKEVVGHGRSHATRQSAYLFRQADQTRRGQAANTPRVVIARERSTFTRARHLRERRAILSRARRCPGVDAGAAIY